MLNSKFHREFLSSNASTYTYCDSQIRWFPFKYIMILFNLLLRHLTLCVRIKMKIYSWVVAHGSFCSKLFSNPSLFSYKQDVSWIKMQNKIQIESLLIHIYTNKRYIMRFLAIHDNFLLWIIRITHTNKWLRAFKTFHLSK